MMTLILNPWTYLTPKMLVNNLRNIDVEPFMLPNEKVLEDMRYNAIDDDAMNLYDDIATALDGL